MKLSQQELAHNKLDQWYQHEATWWHRLIIRMFRYHVNKVAKTALGRAFQRDEIDSKTFHIICAIVDRMLWPEWYEKKQGNVIQSNNTVGGDMAGGDINH